MINLRTHPFTLMGVGGAALKNLVTDQITQCKIFGSGALIANISWLFDFLSLGLADLESGLLALNFGIF